MFKLSMSMGLLLVRACGLVVSIAVLEPRGPGSILCPAKTFFPLLWKNSNFHEEGRIKSSVSDISEFETEFYSRKNL